jgi:AcrR family transcriptional regulator/DNA-binding MarR family transcriptional regulator
MAIKGRVPPARGGTLNGLTTVVPGAGALGRVRVSEIQRARMVGAMVEQVAERGVANVTVAHIVARSGVSRRTFYEIFGDREDCLLAAFDDAIERFAARVTPAYEREERWREKTRAALVALLELLDAEPEMGRLVIVEMLGAGAKALERRRLVLVHVVAVVDGGREEVKGGGEDPPPLTAEGVVGAVLSVLHARLLEVQPGRLAGLVNELMGIVVLPYLGAAAARRELERPAPESLDISHPKTPADPLRELDMRLTYRTVRVLTAVAAAPGSSNRAIADEAEIADQGQISKLLGRLQGLGLVENIGGLHERGGPNAWTLTAKGWEVHAAISTPATTT